LLEDEKKNKKDGAQQQNLQKCGNTMGKGRGEGCSNASRTTEKGKVRCMRRKRGGLSMTRREGG